MTSGFDIDQGPPLFPDLGAAGLRVNRAQLARLFGTSRQAVSIWVRKGWVSLGADGRCDPRTAVAELLRHSDPARLRAKMLEPVVRETVALRSRVADLEAELSMAVEALEFSEGACGDLIGEWKLLRRRLIEAVDVDEGARPVISAAVRWMDALTEGGPRDLRIADFLRSPAPCDNDGGGGRQCPPSDADLL